MQGEDIPEAAGGTVADLELPGLGPTCGAAEATDQGVKLPILHFIDPAKIGDHAQPRFACLVAEGFDDLQVAAPAALGDAGKHVMQNEGDISYTQGTILKKRVTTRNPAKRRWPPS